MMPLPQPLPLNSVSTSGHLESLLATRGERQRALHEESEAVTQAEFGNRVFVRGVVEISNFCRQNCHYCGMRRSRSDLERYRITLEVLLESLLCHRPDCVSDINLQAGEDPKAAREIALPLIKELRARTNLGVTVGLGTLDPQLCVELRAAGASFYIIKFETANPDHYRRLEAPGTLEARLAAIQQLAATGWRVSSGFIAGLPGERPSDLVAALELIARLPLAGASVSPFVPGCDTPLRDAALGDTETALNCVALLRQRHPRHVIPAVSAFNYGEGDGYVRALRAGANLATLNLTPREWRESYPIYTTNRWIVNQERLFRALETANREPNSTSLRDYLEQPAPAG